MPFPDRSTGESPKASAGRFVTVARHEPDFMAYLLGKTPKGLRAVPVESFSVNTGRERATFAVFATSSVCRPAWWMVFAKLLRLELAPLTLAPAVAAAAGLPLLLRAPR